MKMYIFAFKHNNLGCFKFQVRLFLVKDFRWIFLSISFSVSVFAFVEKIFS